MEEGFLDLSSMEFLAQGVLEPLHFSTVHLAEHRHFRLGLIHLGLILSQQKQAFPSCTCHNIMMVTISMPLITNESGT